MGEACSDKDHIEISPGGIPSKDGGKSDDRDSQ
jgi:hypothetical protein